MPLAKWFVILILLVSAGCSAAADSAYIAPRTLRVDPSTYDEIRLIAYRTLVRSDFRAPTPPAGMEGKSVAAVTAALIRTSNVIITTEARETDGRTMFLATADNVHFEARMSQNHSWWNPKHRTEDGELLEHEQVHFAFSELAARRANAEIEDIKSRIRSHARTPDDAIRAAARRLQHEVDRIQEQVNTLNEQFDRETVNGQRCEHNHRWFEHVQHELARSSVDYLASRPPLMSYPAP